MLSDISITELCKDKKMISPFNSESVSKREDGMSITSNGTSSYGYDLSLGPTYRRLRTRDDLVAMGWHLNGVHGKELVMDPSNFNPIFYGDVERIPEEGLLLMPGEFILSVSNEHINMPADVSAICMQKSTCARTHLRVEVTPLEAGWSGYVTYEITNPTSHPILLHVGQGITQALFFKGDRPCKTTYLDRGGKYQNQPQEPVIPRSKHKPTVGYPCLERKNHRVVLSNLEIGFDDRDNIHQVLHIAALIYASKMHPGPETIKEIEEHLYFYLPNKGSLRDFEFALDILNSDFRGVSLSASRVVREVVVALHAKAKAAAEQALKPVPVNNDQWQAAAKLVDETKQPSTGFNGTSSSDLQPQPQRPLASYEDAVATETAATKAWYESARTDVSIEDAIKVLAKAIHTDQGYAWSWICNLAMMAQDAGASNSEANKGAAGLMYNLFKYRAWAVNDTYKDHFKTGQQASFSENGVRHGLDEKAVQDLILSARTTGFTLGAKPGSTAAKLGILPENAMPISTISYLTDNDSDVRTTQIHNLIEKVRNGELSQLLIKKMPE